VGEAFGRDSSVWLRGNLDEKRRGWKPLLQRPPALRCVGVALWERPSAATRTPNLAGAYNAIRPSITLTQRPPIQTPSSPRETSMRPSRPISRPWLAM
jgi:hypothetical protein